METSDPAPRWLMRIRSGSDVVIVRKQRMERAGEMNDDRTAFHTIYKEQWLRLVLPEAVKKTRRKDCDGSF
jgi:hypothetical protein